MLITKIKSLKEFNCTVLSYRWKYCEHHYLGILGYTNLLAPVTFPWSV